MNGRPGKQYGANIGVPSGLNSLFTDTLKGSYYANPIVDTPNVTETQRQAYHEYYGTNICQFHLNDRKNASERRVGPANDVPGIEGFEESFKLLGR